MENVNDLKNRLNDKIKLKDYTSAIQILKDSIIQFYIENVKEIDSSFKYTSITNLMEKSNKNLNLNLNKELCKYFNIINDDCSEQYELYCLMEIYSNINKGGYSQWNFHI